MRVIDIDTIRGVLPDIDLVSAIEKGFAAYSDGRAVVGPVGELLFDDPPGDVHIKYGYIRGDDYYVIKIASGFYDNPKLGLPSSNGLMLVFRVSTGEPLALLADEGCLTDIRTAVAGAVAARYLAPKPVDRIGIIGSGTQARLQLLYLSEMTGCRKVAVWGPTPANVERYRGEMAGQGFEIQVAESPGEVAAASNVIVTTTPSREALLDASDLRPGTHITAVGSDTPGKQELSSDVLGRADRVVADSLVQCVDRGEIGHAVRAGVLDRGNVVELGAIITSGTPVRSDPNEITVADLTGVAVQDIQIARAVYEAAQGPLS